MNLEEGTAKMRAKKVTSFQTFEGTQSNLFSVRVVQHVNPNYLSYLSYQIATTLFRFREAS